MYLKEYFPFYTTYANPLLYEGERMQDKEFNLMKSYYPGTVQHIQEKIEEECDLMDYEGSRLYDEYPDRMTLYKMAQDIYAVLEQEEKREQAEAAARSRAQTEADCKAMVERAEQEVQQRWQAFDHKANELLDQYRSTDGLPSEET